MVRHKAREITRREALPAIGALFTGAGLLGACGGPQKPMGSTRELRTFSLSQLERNKNYIVLIDAFDGVKELSRAIGLEGKYGHIEVVRDGKVYGCRPFTCSKTTVSDMEDMFEGFKFEVREIPIDGSPERAVQWFLDNLEGESYDFLYRNCTDAVRGMYENSGSRERLLYPVDVDETYENNAKLRRIMKEHGIEKPDRKDGVLFPDHFLEVGTLVGKGRFGK